MECCPVCGSRDISPIAGGCLGQVYACKSCSYRGSLVVVCEGDGTRPGRGGNGEEGH